MFRAELELEDPLLLEPLELIYLLCYWGALVDSWELSEESLEADEELYYESAFFATYLHDGG